MAIKGRTLVIIRGSSKTLVLTVKDKNKELVDLTDSKVLFTIKRNIEDSVGAVRKTTDVAAEAILLPQSGSTLGQAHIFLSPSDTSGLEPARDYVYDVWVELPSGKRHAVILPSQLDLRRSVTEDFS